MAESRGELKVVVIVVVIVVIVVVMVFCIVVVMFFYFLFFVQCNLGDVSKPFRRLFCTFLGSLFKFSLSAEPSRAAHPTL